MAAEPAESTPFRSTWAWLDLPEDDEPWEELEIPNVDELEVTSTKQSMAQQTSAVKPGFQEEPQFSSKARIGGFSLSSQAHQVEQSQQSSQTYQARQSMQSLQVQKRNKLPMPPDFPPLHTEGHKAEGHTKEYWRPSADSSPECWMPSAGSSPKSWFLVRPSADSSKQDTLSTQFFHMPDADPPTAKVTTPYDEC